MNARLEDAQSHSHCNQVLQRRRAAPAQALMASRGRGGALRVPGVLTEQGRCTRGWGSSPWRSPGRGPAWAQDQGRPRAAGLARQRAPQRRSWGAGAGVEGRGAAAAAALRAPARRGAARPLGPPTWARAAQPSCDPAEQNSISWREEACKSAMAWGSCGDHQALAMHIAQCCSSCFCCCCRSSVCVCGCIKACNLCREE